MANVSVRSVMVDDCQWYIRVSKDLSFFVTAEDSSFELPANGGLRFLNYASNEEALVDSLILTQLMHQKHSLYNTGFSGAKIVARGEVNEKNKALLLPSIANFLNSQGGKIYTGCDQNTNLDDMNFLFTQTPYLLSSLGTNINSSYATSYGILGSIAGALDNKESKQCSFLVHGIGKTGHLVAQTLVNSDHIVYTHDIVSHIPPIQGSLPVANDDWVSLPVDCLVLCSASRIITEDIARSLRCKMIISGANNPFKNKAVEKILMSRGVKWVPDSLTNAGAVICDSIEFYNNKAFMSASPSQVYDFVYKTVFDKVCEHKQLSEDLTHNERGLRILENLHDENSEKCGEAFCLNDYTTN